MLRSSEIKPLFVDLSQCDKSFSFFFFSSRWMRMAGELCFFNESIRWMCMAGELLFFNEQF